MATNGITGKDASIYTDFAALTKLKAEANKDDQAALQRVAEQFEQIFMDMMLKTMREASSDLAADNPFNSSQVQFYQGMYDQQLTLELSQKGGMGLAEIIVKQLGGTDLSPETLKQALQLPTSDDDVGDRLNSGQSLNETLLNLAARRVATHSLAAVDQISDKLSQRVVQESSTVEAGADRTEVAGGAAAWAAKPVPANFDSPEQFVETLLPLAQQAAQQLGVDPRVLVAQAALETGWGKSIIRDNAGNSSHNLFNIKAGSQWDGDTVAVQTLEFRNGLPQPEQARFRAYDSLEQGFDDYVRLINSNPRYSEALKQVEDPVAYLQALQRAGYATDPAYADKIERIFNGMQLAVAGNTQEG